MSAQSEATDDDIRIVEYAGPHGTLIVDNVEYPRGVLVEMPVSTLQRLNDTRVTADHRVIDHGKRTKTRVADPPAPVVDLPSAGHGEPAAPAAEGRI
jgi:hypothetical protein